MRLKNYAGHWYLERGDTAYYIRAWIRHPLRFLRAVFKGDTRR